MKWLSGTLINIPQFHSARFWILSGSSGVQLIYYKFLFFYAPNQTAKQKIYPLPQWIEWSTGQILKTVLCPNMVKCRYLHQHLN